MLHLQHFHLIETFEFRVSNFTLCCSGREEKEQTQNLNGWCQHKKEVRGRTAVAPDLRGPRSGKTFIEHESRKRAPTPIKYTVYPRVWQPAYHSSVLFYTHSNTATGGGNRHKNQPIKQSSCDTTNACSSSSSSSGDPSPIRRFSLALSWHSLTSSSQVGVASAVNTTSYFAINRRLQLHARSTLTFIIRGDVCLSKRTCCCCSAAALLLLLGNQPPWETSPRVCWKRQ